MNQLARVITRHTILATFKLELEPKGNGYNLIIKDHDISLDGGVALDACTEVRVAGPQILLFGDRQVRLRSCIELPTRLII